jgi:hypothetical protein
MRPDPKRADALHHPSRPFDLLLLLTRPAVPSRQGLQRPPTFPEQKRKEMEKERASEETTGMRTQGSGDACRDQNQQRLSYPYPWPMPS